MNQLLASFPQEPVLLVIAAELAAQQGHFERTVTLLDRAESVQPNSILILDAKARARLRMGQPDRALEEVERALRIDPRDVPSRLLAAQVHLARNHPEQALPSVEQALAVQPESVEIHLLRAEVLRRVGLADEAIAELQDLVTRRKDILAAYSLLAEIYQEQRNDAKALEVLRAGRRQFADDPALGQKEIAVLCRLGRVEEAEQIAQRLAGPKPDADVCLALGATFLGGNELTAARRWAERGMALARPNGRGKRRRGCCWPTSASCKAAAPRTRPCWPSRATITARCFQQPENLLAANNLAWLLAAEFGQPDKAREVVDQALRKTVRETTARRAWPTRSPWCTGRRGNWTRRNRSSTRPCGTVPTWRR